MQFHRHDGFGQDRPCIGLMEEAALQGIPAILIDPRASDQPASAFPRTAPSDFQPWLDADTLRRKANCRAGRW